MAPKGLKVNGVRVAQARLNLPGAPSQAAFAERLGIHWVTQSRIETGKALVSLELLERIAETTGTTREHLLGDDEDEEAAQLPSLSSDLFQMAVDAAVKDALSRLSKAAA